MLRITDLARHTGASVDEIRYLETKGFIKSKKLKLRTREVRQFQEDDARAVELTVKYHRQGFTWKVAHEKARQEINRPSLFQET
jgi:DNA-binding transcriptional MerR regulator